MTASTEEDFKEGGDFGIEILNKCKNKKFDLVTNALWMAMSYLYTQSLHETKGNEWELKATLETRMKMLVTSAILRYKDDLEKEKLK